VSRSTLEEIQRQVAASAGHDPDAIKQMKAGAVFEIDDALIRFPQDADREPHPLRRVILVQSAEYLTGTIPKTALVVPCSASGSRSRGDVAIADDEPGFTKPSVAYTTLVMPILRGDLRREHFKGHVRPETLARLHAQLHKLLAG
jgi:hypothetical protein